MDHTTGGSHTPDSLSDVDGDLLTDTSDTSLSDVLESPAFGEKDGLDLENSLQRDLQSLFDENVFAKIYRVGIEALIDNSPPHRFPEVVPQEGDGAGRYCLREAEFWTCGFFPGSLFSLLERAVKHPASLSRTGHAGVDDEDGRRLPVAMKQLQGELRTLCRTWSAPLHDMASRTDTHDIGFIIEPALRVSWELTHDEQSLESIIQAAHSLATRYVPSAGAIRSWDLILKTDVDIRGLDDNLLVIIDSMCNLDLLFYAAAHGGGARLAEIATSHARTLMRTHLRKENAVPTSSSSRYRGQLYSTRHVVNLDPADGSTKRNLTGQGYAAESTWARGQAWAILGYSQVYSWTKDPTFLHVACGVAEYFIYRLETSPDCVDVLVEDRGAIPGKGATRLAGRHVPLWDFDAPIENPQSPLRDSSAGVIAANGLLILSQHLKSAGQDALSSRYLEAAVTIVKDTLALCLAPETAIFSRHPSEEGKLEVEDVVAGQRFDALLKHATANNNATARKRYRDHGLVYGDYYLIEFGNRLLRMGLV
ncbi:unsaturated glucuronyl hydrolase [Cladophialophora carrionii]|uniref:Unsaturated glucuronyl hydrolase n=1 Tax=Cladophialophora carrionii TaxID=86049 RepID=A0A1C1CPC3_9EURO|nr:unsaturated glucuronyl hydrolase [Cladophialophora carrionii]